MNLDEVWDFLRRNDAAIGALSAAVTAVLTLVLGWTSWRYQRLAQRLANEQHRSERTPNLVVAEMTTTGDGALIRLVNLGSSTAFIKAVHVVVEGGPYPYRDELTGSVTEQVVAPGGSFTFLMPALIRFDREVRARSCRCRLEAYFNYAPTGPAIHIARIPCEVEQFLRFRLLARVEQEGLEVSRVQSRWHRSPGIPVPSTEPDSVNLKALNDAALMDEMRRLLKGFLNRAVRLPEVQARFEVLFEKFQYRPVRRDPHFQKYWAEFVAAGERAATLPDPEDDAAFLEGNAVVDQARTAADTLSRLLANFAVELPVFTPLKFAAGIEELLAFEPSGPELAQDLERLYTANMRDLEAQPELREAIRQLMEELRTSSASADMAKKAVEDLLK